MQSPRQFINPSFPVSPKSNIVVSEKETVDIDGFTLESFDDEDSLTRSNEDTKNSGKSKKKSKKKIKKGNHNMMPDNNMSRMGYMNNTNNMMGNNRNNMNNMHNMNSMHPGMNNMYPMMNNMNPGMNAYNNPYFMSNNNNGSNYNDFMQFQNGNNNNGNFMQFQQPGAGYNMMMNPYNPYMNMPPGLPQVRETQQPAEKKKEKEENS
jgi:hypothetical protein